MEWKQKFDLDTLKRGKVSYQDHKVTGLKETDGGYEAAVLSRQRFEVTIRIRDGKISRMRCTCPVSKGGRNCEHMAAVLYAIEGKGQPEKERIESDWQSGEDSRQEEWPEAELMEQWLKMDRRLREQEKRGKTQEPEQVQEQKSAQKQKPVREQGSPQKQRLVQKREEAQKQEKAQEQKNSQESHLTAEERQMRNLAREKRKAEAAQKKEEQRRKAEEERQKEYERRRMEEERREKIRQQKAEEARLKAEKKQKEQEEARRLADERQKKEERKRKREEAKKRAEEKRRREEEEARRKAEEAHMMEEARKAAERREEEARRQTALKRYQSEYTLLGGAAEEEDLAADLDRSKNIEELENYSYFDAAKIRKSVKVPEDIRKRAEQLRREGRFTIDNIFQGYEQGSSEILGVMEATAQNSSEKFPVTVLFSRTAVKSLECNCPNCRYDYYTWRVSQIDCPYKAGAVQLLEDYLKHHNLGDATDYNGHMLLSSYRKKSANLVISDTEAKKESLKFIPRLIRKDDRLSVSFKIGEGKLFIVKKLDEFCANVRNSATETYGSNTQINHSIDNFTEKGKEWFRFVNRVVQEEMEFQQRLLEQRDYYDYRKKGLGSSLNLFGWRLDEFYSIIGEGDFEFEDRDLTEKRKTSLKVRERNPKVTMQISPEMTDRGKTFQGIRVEGSLPELFYGADHAYYTDKNYLNRVEKDFLEKIEPLAKLSQDDYFSFCVGRNRLSEFYYRILPQLGGVVDIVETDPDEIQSYLLPEVRFFFYLDAPTGNVTCRVNARYGEKEVSVLDIVKAQDGGELEPFRDVGREDEVLYLASQWFPAIDWQREEMHCDRDEGRIYDLVNGGTDKLMEIGEVRCTKRFMGMNTVRHVKVSVGVSVSSGLLDLNIVTDDVSQMELLDILSSYRTKKKYYRMKDGAFVNLEDSSLEMLAELMDAMHLKPKEFAKGKMHLPMYRTLYLDKMLEEHEDVYSDRDSHFREVVKGFKTVKDADYEEPESLSKVMRKYQKNGYKWLRTLEAWQFGGILADDMGLGKTLQVIAVLLAAKQEGKEGTSLVVVPASVVFNWGEEFARFAPELQVLLVTGTQEERKSKIEEYQDYDVLVTSYDLLKRDIACYEEKQFCYEVIDEAQYIKNHTTAAAKAVKVIRSQTRYALTGTPIENRLSELWSIFDYLMPGFLYGYDVFKREIETPVVKYRDEAAMKRLQKMVGPFILRRLKEDVLKDLPEKLEESRYVRFGNEQQKLYDAQVVHMKERIARQDAAEFNKNKMQILAELTRLRQICCDPSLCFENYKGEAAKLEACLQLIQSAIDGGHRMLVFSQFTSMLEILKKKLDEEKIVYYTITGSTSKEKRLQMVKEFNEGDVPVFLISLKAGGVGLNLTGADVVIHYDPWWNLAVQNQATDRAHRIGQSKKVTVYKLIAKGTIEEKIQELQETKKDLAEQVIGGETGQLGSLSKEELLELLGV